MADIGRRRAEIFLIVEEIISSSFVVVNTVVNQLGETELIRRRCEREIRYVMADRIPDQVKHLDSLVFNNDVNCLEQLRMPRPAFARLYFLLKHVGGLTDSRYVSVTEKVALILSVLSHHKKNRVVKFDFQRSGHTVSTHFHTVLATILKLHPILLAKPEPVDDNCTSSSWRWFKGCLGALDGTYIKVTVSDSDKGRYRTRKGDISVNILGVCERNMKFVYVLVGWEGSAAGCRVLRDAVSRQNGFKVPQGHYYLCDNGYTNADGFLTPYKGVRYHLEEWGEGCRAPQNYQEYFNMSHSKARNVIERTFGLLKKCWAILRSPTFYQLKAQNRIIMACALLHNFLRNEIPIDPLLDDLDDIEILHEGDENRQYIESVEPTQQWSNWRESLARSMFDDWRSTRNTG